MSHFYAASALLLLSLPHGFASPVVQGLAATPTGQVVSLVGSPLRPKPALVGSLENKLESLLAKPLRNSSPGKPLTLVGDPFAFIPFAASVLTSKKSSSIASSTKSSTTLTPTSTTTSTTTSTVTPTPSIASSTVLPVAPTPPAPPIIAFKSVSIQSIATEVAPLAAPASVVVPSVIPASPVVSSVVEISSVAEIATALPLAVSAIATPPVVASVVPAPPVLASFIPIPAVNVSVIPVPAVNVSIIPLPILNASVIPDSSLVASVIPEGTGIALPIAANATVIISNATAIANTSTTTIVVTETVPFSTFITSSIPVPTSIQITIPLIPVVESVVPVSSAIETSIPLPSVVESDIPLSSVVGSVVPLPPVVESVIPLPSTVESDIPLPPVLESSVPEPSTEALLGPQAGALKLKDFVSLVQKIADVISGFFHVLPPDSDTPANILAPPAISPSAIPPPASELEDTTDSSEDVTSNTKRDQQYLPVPLAIMASLLDTLRNITTTVASSQLPLEKRDTLTTEQQNLVSIAAAKIAELQLVTDALKALGKSQLAKRDQQLTNVTAASLYPMIMSMIDTILTALGIPIGTVTSNLVTDDPVVALSNALKSINSKITARSKKSEKRQLDQNAYNGFLSKFVAILDNLLQISKNVSVTATPPVTPVTPFVGGPLFGLSGLNGSKLPVSPPFFTAGGPFASPPPFVTAGGPFASAPPFVTAGGPFASPPPFVTAGGPFAGLSGVNGNIPTGPPFLAGGPLMAGPLAAIAALAAEKTPLDVASTLAAPLSAVSSIPVDVSSVLSAPIASASNVAAILPELLDLPISGGSIGARGGSLRARQALGFLPSLNDLKTGAIPSAVAAVALAPNALSNVASPAGAVANVVPLNGLLNLANPTQGVANAVPLNSVQTLASPAQGVAAAIPLNGLPNIANAAQGVPGTVGNILPNAQGVAATVGNILPNAQGVAATVGSILPLTLPAESASAVAGLVAGLVPAANPAAGAANVVPNLVGGLANPLTGLTSALNPAGISNTVAGLTSSFPFAGFSPFGGGLNPFPGLFNPLAGVTNIFGSFNPFAALRGGLYGGNQNPTLATTLNSSPLSGVTNALQLQGVNSVAPVKARDITVDKAEDALPPLPPVAVGFAPDLTPVFSLASPVLGAVAPVATPVLNAAESVITPIVNAAASVITPIVNAAQSFVDANIPGSGLLPPLPPVPVFQGLQPLSPLPVGTLLPVEAPLPPVSAPLPPIGAPLPPVSAPLTPLPSLVVGVLPSIGAIPLVGPIPPVGSLPPQGPLPIPPPSLIPISPAVPLVTPGLIALPSAPLAVMPVSNAVPSLLSPVAPLAGAVAPIVNATGPASPIVVSVVDPLHNILNILKNLFGIHTAQTKRDSSVSAFPVVHQDASLQQGDVQSVPNNVAHVVKAPARRLSTRGHEELTRSSQAPLEKRQILQKAEVDDFINKWHPMTAALSETNPAVVDDIFEVFMDPSSSPPIPASLDEYSDSLRSFMLDLYDFSQYLNDDDVSAQDKMDILRVLFDGHLGYKSKRSMRNGARSVVTLPRELRKDYLADYAPESTGSSAENVDQTAPSTGDVSESDPASGDYLDDVYADASLV
jgi:hypothetical protein